LARRLYQKNLSTTDPRSQTFSLVVPTYNRPVFLQRLLRYYAELRFPHAVVVADSSSGSALEENRKLIGSAQKSLGISHQVFAPDTSPYGKLASTLGSLESTYAAVCADDDFIVPDGVARCLDFLEANPQYSIAHGRSTAVLVAERSAAAQDSEIWGASTYPQRTIDADSPVERLEDHLRCYTATYYSVHRRLQLAANLRQANDYTVDYRFGELLASCLSIIQGKAKCLDVMYMVRQAELGPATRKYSEKMLPWDNLLLLDDFSIRYSRFRGCLAEELVATSGIAAEDAQAVVNRAFLSYLAPNLYAAVGADDWKKERDKATINQLHRPAQRMRRLIRALPAATRAAIVDRQLLRMIKDPRASYHQMLAMNDDMSLPALLNSRSPFHGQFMSVYKYLKPGANGIVRDTRRKKKD
jgi:glycosyltransferase domain-containing protein